MSSKLQTIKPVHIFLLILLVEVFSFFAWLAPILMPLFFAMLIAIMYLITIRNFENGLIIVFTELAIGSMGYLFWLNTGSFKVSIRIGFFVVLMLIWFTKFCIPGFINYFKEKNYNNRFIINYKNSTLWFFIIFIFIALSLLVALFKGNMAVNIFYDFNAWLYFLLILPILSVIKNTKHDKLISKLKTVSSGAITWISVKTLLLLFLFSHSFSFLPTIYKWIRDTRIGEITQMPGGFARIFFQSHIFVLIAFFIFFIFLMEYLNKSISFKKLIKTWDFNRLFIAGISSILITIISFSRSNWVGMLLGITILLIFIITNHPNTNLKKPVVVKLNPKLFFKSLWLLFLSVSIGLLLLFMLIKIPVPGVSSSLNAGKDLKNRLSNISTEAGVSSRWNLLPVLKNELKSNFIFGSGFGATLTYISDDPRVRADNPDGEYTTYAFEWGWLDIWLKLGFFGFISYIILLAILSFEGLSSLSNKNFKNKEIILGLCFGLIVLAGINFFSPYLNHPLGIGYILFVYLFIRLNNKEVV